MRISEIFCSIQGEGILSGYWNTFVRFQGCSVGCSWCDTKYTWDFHAGEPMDVEQIVSRVRTRRVILTGGEPAQQPKSEMMELVRQLHQRGHYLQLETSGRFFAPWIAEVDWRTVSPKPPTYEVHPELIPLVDELKYVVDDQFTPERVLTPLPKKCTVSLQPESNRPDRIEQALHWIRQHDDWRLSLQSHKFLGLR